MHAEINSPITVSQCSSSCQLKRRKKLKKHSFSRLYQQFSITNSCMEIRCSLNIYEAKWTPPDHQGPSVLSCISAKPGLNMTLLQCRVNKFYGSSSAFGRAPLLSWRSGGKCPCPAVGGNDGSKECLFIIGNPYPIPYRNVSLAYFFVS
jgi:hypothetical protein